MGGSVLQEVAKSRPGTRAEAGAAESVAHKRELVVRRRWERTGELLAVFLLMPLLIYCKVLPNWPVALLILVVLGAVWVLRRDEEFDRRGWLSWKGVWNGLQSIWLQDALLIAALGVAVWWFRSDLLFALIKRSPWLWAAIMLLYPVVSVYPQELLFRSFFFHRYKALFGTRWGIVAASAAAFGFVHIVFGNWISIALCVIGGVLFARTYQRTRSLLLVCLEHALFGNFIFTIGLGKFFVPGGH